MTELEKIIEDLEDLLHNTDNMRSEEEDGLIETLVSARIMKAQMANSAPEIYRKSE